ncbi:MAG: hypothetical protein NG737_06380 [Omnitrophica bacterium]|nr:hypothetical protein [Candidatus Omnitrophota bacterium]
MNTLYLIYDFVFILGFIIYLPVYILRRKITFRALKEKLGFITRVNNPEGVIWIQVVSVGETNLIGNLIRKLKEQSNLPLVISTTTLTGNKIARKNYSQFAKIIFFPFDVSFIVEKVIKIIKPKLFVAVETEIWPHLFRCLHKSGIPIIIINGRISKGAFSRYKLIRPLVKKVLSKCRYIGVQNEEYKQKFIFLGAENKKVILTGNMKFEGISVDKNILLKVQEKYSRSLKKQDKIILIAASTHSPEEEIILSVYKDIIKSVKNVVLFVAPRHPERVHLIEKIIQAEGFEPIRISQMNGYAYQTKHVLLVDTIGELLYLYDIADVCFVGGTLSNDGGHNILEPIYFSKPTVFGPSMDNFLDIQEVVLKKGAGIKVATKNELLQVLSMLVNDRSLRENLQNRCRDVFEDEKESLENNLQLIFKCL